GRKLLGLPLAFPFSGRAGRPPAILADRRRRERNAEKRGDRTARLAAERAFGDVRLRELCMRGGGSDAGRRDETECQPCARAITIHHRALMDTCYGLSASIGRLSKRR